jgi:hypothetical protein
MSRQQKNNQMNQTYLNETLTLYDTWKSQFQMGWGFKCKSKIKKFLEEDWTHGCKHEAWSSKHQYCQKNIYSRK